MILTRECFVPQESERLQNIKKLVVEGVPAEVYVYESKVWVNNKVNGRVQEWKPAAKCFGGKRSKPDSSYYYNSEETRDAAVKKYFDNAKANADYKKQLKAEKKSKGRGLDLGDFLACSWGYDQTNVNFYKVVALKGKTMVMIVPVGASLVSSEPPCDKVVPSDAPMEYDVLLGQNRGEVEPVAKVAKDGSVSINDHQRAYKWDGKPCYETSSGWGH